MSLIGPLIDGSDVERALLAHLEYWMPSYLGQLLLQKDPDKELWPAGVSPIEQYTVRHAAADAWPSDYLPMLLAHCPNDGGEPWQASDGKVQVKFAVGLSAIAEGIDTQDSKDLARLYASAALLAIMQKPDLAGGGEPFAAGVKWHGFENMRVTRGVEAERSLMATGNLYTVTVDGALNTLAGLDAPLEDPDEDLGERPRVKEGGAHLVLKPGQAAVARLREGGFFEQGEEGAQEVDVP
jgi:hypothetical protein